MNLNTISMFYKVRKHYHWYGFRATVQKILQKLIGVSDLQEEVDSLHYFLNVFHEAQNAPQTSDPDLRLLQLCDTQLLRVVANECEKLGLTYWLEFGTLLGAVRHKGFIPWDDDMDIAMPREDYNRALIELKDALEPLGIELQETNHIGIGYKHNETGVWLDIFAIDEFFTNQADEFINEKLKRNIIKCRKKSYNRNNATIKWKEKQRCRYIGGDENGKYRLLYLQPEFDYNKEITHEEKTVFPLKKIFYEGCLFKVPNNYDLYLRDIYGSHYMSFPRKGVLHHDLGRGALSTWAKRNGVNMEVILEELTEIANK
jgi:lipopolysaccharide cholinephosphotransferase